MLRNGWPEWSGISGRNQAEYAFLIVFLYLETTQNLLIFLNYFGSNVGGDKDAVRKYIKR